MTDGSYAGCMRINTRRTMYEIKNHPKKTSLFVSLLDVPGSIVSRVDRWICLAPVADWPGCPLAQ